MDKRNREREVGMYIYVYGSINFIVEHINCTRLFFFFFFI